MGADRWRSAGPAATVLVAHQRAYTARAWKWASATPRCGCGRCLRLRLSSSPWNGVGIDLTFTELDGAAIVAAAPRSDFCWPDDEVS
jgi:hypothetical protein